MKYVPEQKTVPTMPPRRKTNSPWVKANARLPELKEIRSNGARHYESDWVLVKFRDQPMHPFAVCKLVAERKSGQQTWLTFAGMYYPAGNRRVEAWMEIPKEAENEE